MKVKKREFESKNIQTFFVIKQKKKIFKNKRKYNELFNNKINLKDYEKCFKYRSLRNSLENIINDKQSKLFNTEVENKNNFLSNRINYSILGGKKKIFNANNYSLSPVNNLKKTIFNTVLDMCHDLYESKNKDNNKRIFCNSLIIASTTLRLYSSLFTYLYNASISSLNKSLSTIVTLAIFYHSFISPNLSFSSNS